MRHAKSSWKHTGLVDHERPLNGRGEKSAKLMAQVLTARGFAPDQIWSSDSVRTTQTAKWLIRGIPGAQFVRYFPEFYHASPDDVFEVLANQDAPQGAIMLLGHNPGWASLSEIYTGRARGFPTAACCVLGLKHEAKGKASAGRPWYDPQNWQLKAFITPKDLGHMENSKDGPASGERA